MFHSTHSLCLKPRSLIGGEALIRVIAVLSIGVAAAATAQTQESTTPAKTQVLSRPTGAVVFMKGEYGLAGRAPYTIGHYLKGHYKITARKHGYEDWSSDFYFTGKGTEKLSIKLSPKTRPKALYRSMLFPGWGQNYSDQRAKGKLIALAQCTTLGVFFYQSSRYNDALDDFNAAASAYAQGKDNASQRPILQAELDRAQTRLDDRYEARRRWGLFAATVYLYNLLDVVLFFPSYHRNGMDVSLTLSPPENPASEGARIGLQAQF